MSNTTFPSNPRLKNAWFFVWLIAAVLVLPRYMAPQLGQNTLLLDVSNVISPRIDLQDDLDIKALLPGYRWQISWLLADGISLEEYSPKRDSLNLKTQIRAPPVRLSVAV